MTNRTFTTSELAAVLGLSKTTIKNWIRRGYIHKPPYTVQGRERVWSWAEAEQVAFLLAVKRRGYPLKIGLYAWILRDEPNEHSALMHETRALLRGGHD